jgi:hypothetical protein
VIIYRSYDQWKFELMGVARIFSLIVVVPKWIPMETAHLLRRRIDEDMPFLGGAMTVGSASDQLQ